MSAALGQIGDINSEERGSGARYNAGKPPLELIPLDILGRYFVYENHPLGQAMIELGKFQRGGAAACLYQAIDIVGPAWIEAAQVFAYGRAKYAAWNWSKGMPWSVPIACAARHLLAMINGEENDHESGLPHRGHMLCNIIMLITYIDTYQEGDDRPKHLVLHPETQLQGAFALLRAANIARDAEWCTGGKLDLSYRGNELAGETGEACNILKKLDRERKGMVGSRATTEQAAEELADIAICVDLAAMFNKTSEKNGLQTRLVGLA
jgi:hypothetical protein